MSDQNNARTVTAETTKKNGVVDVTSLVLLAILLAAGFILNMTVGNALAIVGIKPQFIISAYCLAILLTKASFVQAIIYGVISACVIQITTSIPGLNFLSETVAALAMAALIRIDMKLGGKDVTPFVATLVTTFISGGIFAVVGTVIMGAAIETVVVKVPIVVGTALFGAIVVQALYFPLRKVLKK